MAENQEILKGALLLPARERAGLVDQLLASLDKPDPAIDELWRKEIDRRLAAYESGEMETVSLEDALAKYVAR